MERYNIAVKENPFDGCPYADMVVSDDGAYMRYDDAKRALDAERADNAMAREAYWATIADLRSELATLQAQLRQVEGELTCSQQFDSAWKLQYWQVEAYGVADECLYRLSNLRKEEANAYAAMLKHRQGMEG